MFRSILNAVQAKHSRLTENLTAPHYIAVDTAEEKDVSIQYADDGDEQGGHGSPKTDANPLHHVESHTSQRDFYDAFSFTSHRGHIQRVYAWVQVLEWPFSGIRSMRALPHSGDLTRLSNMSPLHSLLLLLPSFLIPRTRIEKAKKLHPTAWLDGMRGLAALFVVIYHSSLVWFPWDIHSGWTPGDKISATFFRLPIVRLLISGPPQVAVFFVLSGFAISYKTIKLARMGQFDAASAALSSSVFRRHTRLFLPATIVTLAHALIAYFNPTAWPQTGFPGAAQPVRPAPHASNLTDQLSHFLTVQIHSTKPIKLGLIEASDRAVYGHPYDPNLWTLPIEWSSSMVIFGFLLAFMRLSNRIRMFAIIAVMCYLQWFFVYWGIFLFFGGMLACEVHLELNGTYVASGTSKDVNMTEKAILPRWAIDTRKTRNRILGRDLTRIGSIIVSAGFIFSLWLLSTPEITRGASTAYGFATLVSWAPAHMGDSFLVPLGAILAVLFVDRAGPLLQCLFTNSFSQYLARISFALYLVHGPMLWSIGLKLSKWGVSCMHGDADVITTSPSYFWGIVVGQSLWWPLVVWVADLTARFVDESVVRLTRWAYGKLERKDD